MVNFFVVEALESIYGSQELNSHVILEVNYEKNAIKVYGRIRARALGTCIHIGYHCVEQRKTFTLVLDSMWET